MPARTGIGSILVENTLRYILRISEAVFRGQTERRWIMLPPGQSSRH